MVHMDQDSGGELTSRKLVYKGKTFQVARYKYRLASEQVVRDIIERQDGVIVVPVMENGDILLIREYCAGSNSFVLSLPGGSIDKDEEPVTAAARELREEVGYQPGQLIPLHYAYTHPSTTTRRSYAFLALDLRLNPLPESHEIIEVKRAPLAQAIEEVSTPFVSDVSTIGCLLLAKVMLANLES